jgi:hypothetical protein
VPPARYLPTWDNLLLSHADRGSVIADEHRRWLISGSGIVAPSFLLDGFVAGSWSVTRNGGQATLQLVPYRRLTQPEAKALRAEGTRLLAFLAPGLKPVFAV